MTAPARGGGACEIFWRHVAGGCRNECTRSLSGAPVNGFVGWIVSAFPFPRPYPTTRRGTLPAPAWGLGPPYGLAPRQLHGLMEKGTPLSITYRAIRVGTAFVDPSAAVE